MRLETIDSSSKPSSQRSVEGSDTDQNLMTAARRAALDALEREFQDLLRSATATR